MIQLLPQNEMLCPECITAEEAVEKINSYIQNTHCEKMSVDISLMNIFDACYVSTLCSTEHYIKYPNGKIKWKISSSAVSEYSKDLSLGNSEYILS